MNKDNYLTRIATARMQKSSRTSADAYAQMDRMARSTSGRFTMKVSGDSSPGAKSKGFSIKGSNR